MGEQRPHLLPCPFCGDDPRYIPEHQGDMNIFCANEYNGCPAPSVYLSVNERDKAIEMWNRRTAPTGKRS